MPAEVAPRPEAPQTPPGPTGSSTGHRVAAWLLLLGWVVLVGAAVVTGERHTTVNDLQDAIADGRVSEVRAAGGLGQGGVGFATIELRWREHGLQYSTEVVQVRGRHQGRSGGDDVTGRFRGSLHDYLTQYGGSVEVQSERSTHGNFSARLLGWRADGWVATLLLALFVLTLLRIATGPVPWRATRWGWTWLVLVLPPIACPAYLLVGGPTRLFPPARPDRRLTGGWAFALALVVGWLGTRP